MIIISMITRQLATNVHIEIRSQKGLHLVL